MQLRDLTWIPRREAIRRPIRSRRIRQHRQRIRHAHTPATYAQLLEAQERLDVEILENSDEVSDSD